MQEMERAKACLLSLSLSGESKTVGMQVQGEKAIVSCASPRGMK